eukprot:jgi/Chrzof1/14506/Cz09g05110.t1
MPEVSDRPARVSSTSAPYNSLLAVGSMANRGKRDHGSGRVGHCDVSAHTQTGYDGFSQPPQPVNCMVHLQEMM